MLIQVKSNNNNQQFLTNQPSKLFQIFKLIKYKKIK